jgi:hypothetical protein
MRGVIFIAAKAYLAFFAALNDVLCHSGQVQALSSRHDSSLKIECRIVAT